MQGQFDEALFRAGDPLAAGEGRKLRGRQALAIGLVTGDAVSFAVEYLSPSEKNRLLGAGLFISLRLVWMTLLMTMLGGKMKNSLL